MPDVLKLIRWRCPMCEGAGDIRLTLALSGRLAQACAFCHGKGWFQLIEAKDAKDEDAG